MSGFDLRHVLHQVLDETDLASPDEITDKVVGFIPQSAVQPVLRMLLRDWIRSEMSRYRMKAPPPEVEQARPIRSARSVKVQAIRAAAPQWLRDRVCVGSGVWSLMQDLTYENLQYLHAARQETAAKHMASAAAFEALGALVKKHRVARVGDLPARVLEAFEWRAAA